MSQLQAFMTFSLQIDRIKYCTFHVEKLTG